jgi:hypothetical protein
MEHVVDVIDLAHGANQHRGANAANSDQVGVTARAWIRVTYR